MARLGKPLSEIHLTLAGLAHITSADLLSIDGPKFITSSSKYGARTLAVLISHDKWKTLNHNVPSVNPHKAEAFYVGEQAYMVIPAVDLGGGVYQAKPETGLKIITDTKLRKRGRL